MLHRADALRSLRKAAAPNPPADPAARLGGAGAARRGARPEHVYAWRPALLRWRQHDAGRHLPRRGLVHGGVVLQQLPHGEDAEFQLERRLRSVDRPKTDRSERGHWQKAPEAATRGGAWTATLDVAETFPKSGRPEKAGCKSSPLRLMHRLRLPEHAVQLRVHALVRACPGRKQRVRARSHGVPKTDIVEEPLHPVLGRRAPEDPAQRLVGAGDLRGAAERRSNEVSDAS